MEQDKRKKFTETEERGKRALDEEADRVRVQQVVLNKDITEREAWDIGMEEGAEEHFTPEEEQAETNE